MSRSFLVECKSGAWRARDSEMSTHVMIENERKILIWYNFDFIGSVCSLQHADLEHSCEDVNKRGREATTYNRLIYEYFDFNYTTLVQNS